MDSNISPTKNIAYQDESFLAKVEDFLNFAIENNDVKSAYNLSRTIKNFLARKKSELEQSPAIYDFYQKILVKAKFVSLPLLDDGEVIDLLKNNFSRQFEIEFYDLAKEFKDKLINTAVYEDRDVLRQEIKKNLLASAEILTSGATSPRTIAEWLRDYNAKLGIERVDSLKRSQYFIDLSKDKKLNDRDREKLKVLFDLYEETKLSSLGPGGYDYDVPIIINDQLYDYKRGLLEKLEGDQNTLARINGLLKSASTGHTPEISGSADKTASVPSAAVNQQLEELRQILNSYPEQSLPRKAVEEEIRKISKK